MIINMAMELNTGLTALVIKVCIKMERRKVKESTTLEKAVLTTVNGSKIKYLDLVNMPGQMVEGILENGLIIKCMVKEFTLGQMGENMMESITMTKNKALEPILGKMVENMRVNGWMERGMEVER